VKATSVEGARRWRGDPVRMLFIDATHSYEAVMEDVRAWAPFLAPSPTVVFDDYQHAGVRAAIDRLHADRVIGDPQLFVGKMIAFAPRRLASAVPAPPGASLLARTGRLGYAISFLGLPREVGEPHAREDGNGSG